MKWKLMKGSWRPNLQKFVDSLTDAAVATATAKALHCVAANDIDGAYKEATVLKGVGFATASALLAAYNPSIPFMADEALTAVVGSTSYTKQEAAALRAACHAKAQQLAAALGGGAGGGGFGGAGAAAAVGGSGTAAASSSSASSSWSSAGDAAAASRVSALPWTANKVQLCLWAAEHYGNPTGKAPQVGWWRTLAPPLATAAAPAGAAAAPMPLAPLTGMLAAAALPAMARGAAAAMAPAAKRARLDSGTAAGAAVGGAAAASDAAATTGSESSAAVVADATAAPAPAAQGSVSGRKRKRA